MIVEPFEPAHLAEVADVDPEYGAYLKEISASAFTIRKGGDTLVCGGVADMGFGRGFLWSFVGPQARRHPFALHRAVKRFLSTLEYRRVEASCESTFGRGCRWLEALGFVREGTMRAFAPDGSDHELYARVM